MAKVKAKAPKLKDIDMFPGYVDAGAKAKKSSKTVRDNTLKLQKMKIDWQSPIR